MKNIGKQYQINTFFKQKMSNFRGNRWITLVIVSLGFFMILIDTTVVNVAIPTLIKELHTSLSEIEWIITGYALSFAALLITFGRLGDVYGRKQLFIIGLVVFVVSSYFSGEAPNASILIIARLFQGVGGAMISPASLSILASSFTGKERAIAFGIWGAIAGVAVAIGPVLGGLLTTYESWRWIFRINIPIGILTLFASLYFISESTGRLKQNLDISGMITSTLGFFFLIFALIEGQTYGWIHPSGSSFSLAGMTWSNTSISIIPVTIALSVIFLTAFIVIQILKTKRNLSPAIDMNFFVHRTFKYGLIAIGVIALGEFSSLFTVPIFLQSIKGFTPIQSGLAVLPLAIATFIAAPLSAQLVNKIGTKWVITTGICTEFLGIFLLSRLDVNTAYPSLVLPFILLGVGIGLAISQNTQVILSEIDPAKTGSASGILNTIRQVGSALGIAIIGAVLSTQLSGNISTQINSVKGIPQNAKTNIITSVNAEGLSESSTSPSLPEASPPLAIQHNPIAVKAFYAAETSLMAKIKLAIDTALASAIASSIRVGSIFVLVGALLSLLIPNIKGKRSETPVVSD